MRRLWPTVAHSHSGIIRQARAFLALLIGACVLLVGQSTQAQLPSGTNWGLTFADEFSGTTLDTMKWSEGAPWDAGLSTPSNISVNNGVLNMLSTRTSSVSSSNSFTNSYVASQNTSFNNLFGMSYGYVEASMKLPTQLGSWPAFWMLASGWPPEIDIMEDPAFVNGTYSAYNYSDNIHYTSNGSAASLGDGVHYASAGDLTQSYNTYGVSWTPTSLSFYINGVKQPSSPITNSTALSNGSGDLTGNGLMYLLLDNIGGGSWPGVPSTSQWPVGTTSDLQVQWVRVWKDTSGSASTISWNNTASNGIGTWTSGSYWSGGAAPQLSSQTAVFGAQTVNNQTVNWNYSQTIGGLSLNSTTSYTIGSASGSLMLASGTSSGASVLIDATSASGSGSNYINSRLELYNNTTMQTSSKPLVVNGQIIGTGVLTIAAGPITLAASSTYTGGTTLNGGTLTAAGNSALGSGAIQFNAGGNNYTSQLALAGGITLNNPITLTARSNSTVAIDNVSGNNALGGTTTLQVGGSNYLIQSDSGTLTLSGSTAITVGATGLRTVTLQGQGNGVISGALVNGAGTLSVSKSGAGTWTLSGSNSYTGATTISGGVLQLANRLPQIALTFANGSIANSGNNASAVSTTLVGSGVSASGSGGPGAGLGALNLTGNAASYLDVAATNLPNLSGTSAYTIGMWVKTSSPGGEFLYKGASTWTTGDEAFFLSGTTGGGASSGLIPAGVQYAGGFAGGGTAVASGSWSFISIVRTSGTSTFYVNGVATGTSTGMGLNEQGTQDIRIGGEFDTISGDGVTAFNGAISGVYLYGSALSQSQIQSLMNSGVASPGSLPSATAVSVTAAGAGLDVNGTQQTIASLSGVAGSYVYLGNGMLTAGDGTSSTFAGSISDSGGASTTVGGSLVKIGTGSLTLSGSNLYTGATTVSAGTLLIAGTSSLPNGTSSVTVGSASSSVGYLNFAGNSVTNLTGSTAATTINWGSSAAIQPGASFITAGTMRLGALTSGTSGAGSSGTVNQMGGTVVINGHDSTSNNRALTIADAASETSTYNLLGGSLSVRGPGVVFVGWNGTGVLNLSGGSASLNEISFGQTGAGPDTGTLNLTSGALYLGSGGLVRGATNDTAIINVGKGTIGAYAPWSSTLAMSLTNTSGANFDTTGGSILLAGAISGSGALTKIGSGTLTLAGSNSYSGGTTVTSGTLILDGASSLLADSRLVIGSNVTSGAVFMAPFLPTNLGASEITTAPVPEPGTLGLLAIAALAALGTWRHRRGSFMPAASHVSI